MRVCGQIYVIKIKMKHHNTKYSYAEGGFGAIVIDLVRNVIIKESRKAGDNSIKNEVKAYKILN